MFPQALRAEDRQSDLPPRFPTARSAGGNVALTRRKARRCRAPGWTSSFGFCYLYCADMDLLIFQYPVLIFLFKNIVRYIA
jgi:hypothetical protein